MMWMCKPNKPSPYQAAVGVSTATVNLSKTVSP